MQRFLIPLTASLACFAVMAAAPSDARAQEAPESVPPAQSFPTEGENCIQINRMDRTQVLDDKTILFIMDGGKVYRNELPHRCPRLGFEEAFSYKTSIGQLCSVDIITVLDTGVGMSGPSCGLGEFVDVTDQYKAARKAGADIDETFGALEMLKAKKDG